MYVDDQDEDVDEEEEFHDVEEEKHKTSQESVGSSGFVVGSPAKESPKQQQPQPQPQPQPQEKIQSEEVSNETRLDKEAPTKKDENTSSDAIAIKEPSELIEPKLISAIPSKDTSQDLHNKLVLEESSLAPTKAVADIAASNSEITVEKQDSSERSAKDIDWANIMFGNGLEEKNQSTAASLQGDIDQAENKLDSQKAGDKNSLSDVDCADDSKLNNLIKDTEDKLKIVDDYNDSMDQKIELKLRTEDLGQNSEAKDTACNAEADEPINSGVTDESVHATDEKQTTGSINGELEANPTTVKLEENEKKELDLDEDVKNPQYIPKKGVFYEHDDRSHDVEEKKPSTSTKKEDDSVEIKEANGGKKAITQEKQPENRRPRRQRTDADRWNHDLFKGEKQKPKSKSELINAYGYDIRQERGGRGQQPEPRQSRTNNNSNADRPQTSQDSQRSRQSKDTRVQRQSQNQPGNRSRERRVRRQNASKGTQQRIDGSENRREAANIRSSRSDVKDPKETNDEKNQKQPSSVVAGAKREQDAPPSSRNSRTDSKGRRKNSRDRPINNDERLPLANTVMPPITTWSNEDMMKAEAYGKTSPQRVQDQIATPSASTTNNAQRDRSTDFWQQNQQNKSVYQDRSMRNPDESRHQSFNSRGRYQERGDENNRPSQYMPRNHYNERSNPNQDWQRAGNFSPYAKSNDYIVKTQTFENSRLAQANINRSSNNRDLREVINQRRMQGQSSYQNKPHHGVDHHTNPRGGINQGQMYHHQYAQSHHLMQHEQQMRHNQQQPPHMIHSQPAPATQHQHQQSQQQTQRHQQLSTTAQQQVQSQTQANHQNQPQLAQTQQLHNQQPTTTQAQVHQSQSRQNVVMSGSTSDNNSQDLNRLSGPNNTDSISRPIIKTDAYTGTGIHPHQQPLSQHSQNFRSMSGPMAQQSPSAAASHMVPTHLGAGASQAQYYASSPGSRDPNSSGAAVATSYHGYIPGGHAVMDATRYHLASQQLADHGYITTPGQTSDVSGGPVLHQQGIYQDTSSGAAAAGSAYLAQPPGSTISPTTNIPVTAAGHQTLPPVTYIQHSQYPPPPYSNPYTHTQPQHNQAPPQSGHAYPPYWTYI